MAALTVGMSVQALTPFDEKTPFDERTPTSHLNSDSAKDNFELELNGEDISFLPNNIQEKLFPLNNFFHFSLYIDII